MNALTQVRARLRKRRVLIAVLAALGLLVPAGAAHAEWYFTKSGAERVAKDFVAGYYANTYEEDLITRCRPQGEPYDPRYKFHRWTCFWYDTSDRNSGAVRIIGSRGRGAYYGRVLLGARRR